MVTTVLRGSSRFKPVIIIALTALLSASFVESAFASTWIVYDDGSKDASFLGVVGSFIGYYAGVKFALPGWYSAILLTARFWLITGIAQSWQLEVHVFDASGYTDLTTPITYTTPSGPFDQFLDLDLRSYGITVGKEFWIALKWTMNGPDLGVDVGPSYGQSYLRQPPGVPDWVPFSFPLPLNLMIRAEVAQTTVGGYVVTTDALGVLAPCLAASATVAMMVLLGRVKRMHRARILICLLRSLQ